MNMPLSERRQIENEMIFRRANEKVSEELQELKAQLIKDDHPEAAVTEDIPIHFLCECSDEDCVERIPIKLSEFQKIHKNRKAFIIKPKHQVEQIEEVISVDELYSVVEKNKSTAEPAGILNDTPINNA